MGEWARAGDDVRRGRRVLHAEGRGRNVPAGGGYVQIAEQQGRWVLQGAADSSEPSDLIAATATCYPWATFGASQSFALSPDFQIHADTGVGSFVPDGNGGWIDVVNLWDSQSFCWLDSVGGQINRQPVRIQATAQTNTLTSVLFPDFGSYGSARCANFGHGGAIAHPGRTGERTWSTGMPEVRLASASAAICYLSGLDDMSGDRSEVHVSRHDGFWWLGGRDSAMAEAECISLPGDAPFTDPHMWTPRLEGWCTQSGGVLGMADMNGDGRSDLWCHDPMNGSEGRTWVALGTDSGIDSNAWTPWMSGWCGQSGATFGSADFNADQRADFWCHDSGATWVALSSGTGVLGDIWTPWMSSWCSSPVQTFGTADITGDSKADFWCHDPDGRTWVAASNGGATMGDIWTPWMSGWCASPGQTFGTGSFDGDPKSDFYCHDPMQWGSPGRTWVALSSGNGATANPRPWLSGWCGLAGQQLGVADFDGDGRSDLYCHDPSGVTWVAPNIQSTAAGVAYAFSANGFQPWLSNWCGSSGATFGVTDFNSDGRADVWCHDASATWTATSTGTTFAGDPWTPKMTGWCSQPGAIFATADFNADRSADFLCHDPMGSATSGDTWVAFR